MPEQGREDIGRRFRPGEAVCLSPQPSQWGNRCWKEGREPFGHQFARFQCSRKSDQRTRGHGENSRPLGHERHPSEVRWVAADRMSADDPPQGPRDRQGLRNDWRHWPTPRPTPRHAKTVSHGSISRKVMTHPSEIVCSYRGSTRSNPSSG